jgi:NADH:ubiquinone oxidoreductase subunit H
VVPFGAQTKVHGVDLFQIADLNIGLLVILGVTSIGVYGIALSGWSSNNKYSLFGSLRATAQVISYELALGLSLVGVVLRAQSLSLRDIVNSQSAHGVLSWNIFGGFQIVGFFIYLMAGVRRHAALLRRRELTLWPSLRPSFRLRHPPRHSAGLLVCGQDLRVPAALYLGSRHIATLPL